MLAGNREFVRKHPVATKRALRAILKATDLCAASRSGPRDLVDGGFTAALRLRAADAEGCSVRPLAGYDPEDTVRFYALRLHEAGMIKSTPQKSSPRAPTGGS